jgi:hypothetical protein
MSTPIPAQIVKLRQSAKIQGHGDEYRSVGALALRLAAAGFPIACCPVVRAGTNRWFKADIGAVHPIYLSC